MAYFRILVILVAMAVYPGVSMAAFQSGTPPKGFRRLPPGHKAQPIDVINWPNIFGPQGPTVRTGGRSVTVPWRIKYAQDASRMMAKGLFGSPQLRLLAGLATWVGLTEIVYDAVRGVWQVPGDTTELDQSDGYYWCHSPNINSGTPSGCGGTNAVIYGTKNAALEGLYQSCLSTYGSERCEKMPEGEGVRFLSNPATNHWINRLLARGGQSDCPPGWYVTELGCIEEAEWRDITDPEEFADILEPVPVPPQAPKDYPHPLPTEGFPEVDPFVIPQGDPVPNPNFDPQSEPGPSNPPYTMPSVTVVHSPTVSDPWRFELKPSETPSETADPAPDVIPDPDVDPETGGSTRPPGTLPEGWEPREPNPDQIGLCDQYPDILACEKLNFPDAEELESYEAPFEFDIEGGFNGEASCPAPITASISGIELELSWQPFCNTLMMGKPLILAFAWLSAAFIMFGSREA